MWRDRRGKIKKNGERKERWVMGERYAGPAGMRSIDGRYASGNKIEMQ